MSGRDHGEFYGGLVDEAARGCAVIVGAAIVVGVVFGALIALAVLP